jgi:archaellum biogenesis ATPase FlaH
MSAARPPAIATGFAALDAMTGCGGVPCGALTLFSGPGTSGKGTIAYKVLANAQSGAAQAGTAQAGTAQAGAAQFSTAQAGASTALLLDLTHTADPGYLQRCGVALDRLLIARPQRMEDRLSLLLDVVQSGRTRLVLVDSVAELMTERAAARQFNGALARLRQLARTSGCAVLLLDESASPWQRWLGVDAGAALRQAVALHVELRREQWVQRNGLLVGYTAQARVLRSLWRSGMPEAPLEIVFNGTVRARDTW